MIMNEYKTLLFEQSGATGVVKVNRPDALNALNAEVLTELAQIFG